MGDSTLYDRQKEYQSISKEQASLTPLIETYQKYKKIQDNITEAKDILANEKDEEMKEMAKNGVSRERPNFD